MRMLFGKKLAPSSEGFGRGGQSGGTKKAASERGCRYVDIVTQWPAAFH